MGPKPASALRDTHPKGRAHAPRQALSAPRPAQGEAAVGKSCLCHSFLGALSASAG